MKKLGIYIHIPFCISKCKYCGFYSHGGSTDAEHAEYIEGLLEDIREYGNVYGDRYTVDTVFIGGGTPTIINASYIKEVMDELKKSFNFSMDAEVSIESNPKTLTKEKLEVYRQAGINRISIGLQTFNDDLLKRLGRVHTASDFEESFRLAREAGFDNINLDLMFAIPGHTMEIWEETMERAIALNPEHISFYSLQIEEGTPFYDMYRRGEFDQIPDDVDREMYHNAIKRFTEAGYNHYEISNCAKHGYECRHNLKYWNIDDYLGIGSSASSFMEGVRFAEEPVLEFHENTFGDNIGEFVFTGLRKTSGIDLNEFKEKYGMTFEEAFADRLSELDEFFETGRLIREGNVLRLSTEGIDVSNKIMSVFV